MVWARLDDAILDNPKIVKAGVFGFALHVAAITWCCRNLTDGLVPYARVTALLTLGRVNIDASNPLALADGPRSMAGDEGLDPYDVADHLVDVGLWSRVEDGYQLHDFLEYNPSRARVLVDREANRKRVQQHRYRASNAVTNDDSNGTVTGHPVPVPQKDLSVEQEKDPVAELWTYVLEQRSARYPGCRTLVFSQARRGSVGARLRENGDERCRENVRKFFDRRYAWGRTDVARDPELLFRSSKQFEKVENAAPWDSGSTPDYVESSYMPPGAAAAEMDRLSKL